MDTPALIVIGATPSLRSRIGASFFPFPLIFQPRLPSLPIPHSLLFLSMPSGLALADAIPGSQPFICAGDADFLPAAFARGAADYLKEPWDADELGVRAGRLLPLGPIPVGESLVLDGAVLAGRRGRVYLGRREAALFRELVSHPGDCCSRAVLRRVLWGELPENSRAVDEAISRIRQYLAQLQGPGEGAQIRSVRGIGYLFHPGF